MTLGSRRGLLVSQQTLDVLRDREKHPRNDMARTPARLIAMTLGGGGRDCLMSDLPISNQEYLCHNLYTHMEVVMSSIPSGTVTFIFTEMENSTRLARKHPRAREKL
jgi:class 3 adenylate cyclase